jgi:hypothetical protein
MPQLHLFNPENDIVFIANEGVVSSFLKIYNVQKGNGDSIAREPITNNINLELRNLFEGKIDFSNRNVIRFERKKIRLQKFLKNLFSIAYLKKTIKFGFYRIIKKNYIHYSQY